MLRLAAVDTLGDRRVGVTEALRGSFRRIVGRGLGTQVSELDNLFTTTSDMFPRSAVGSVVGIGGTMGATASVLLQIATGYIVEWTHSYLPLFILGGSAYLIALGIFHLLSPKLEPVELD